MVLFMKKRDAKELVNSLKGELKIYLNELTDSLTQLITTSNSSLIASIGTLQDEVVRLSKMTKSIMDELTDLFRAQKDSLRALSRALDTITKHVQERLRDLEDKESRFKILVDQLEAKVSHYSSEYNKLVGQLDEGLSRWNKTLSSHIMELSKILQELKAQRSEIKSALDTIELTITKGLSELYTKIETFIEKSESSFNKISKTMEMYEDNVKKFSMLNEDLTKTLNDLIKLENTANSRLSDLRKLLEQLNVALINIADLALALENTSKILVKAKQDIDNSRRRSLDELRSELKMNLELLN